MIDKELMDLFKELLVELRKFAKSNTMIIKSQTSTNNDLSKVIETCINIEKNGYKNTDDISNINNQLAIYAVNDSKLNKQREQALVSIESIINISSKINSYINKTKNSKHDRKDIAL